MKIMSDTNPYKYSMILERETGKKIALLDKVF